MRLLLLFSLITTFYGCPAAHYPIKDNYNQGVYQTGNDTYQGNGVYRMGGNQTNCRTTYNQMMNSYDTTCN